MLLLLGVAQAWSAPVDLPMAYSARRPTLPRLAVRLDVDSTVLPTQLTQGIPTVDFAAGFGVGITRELEIGAQLLPIEFAPELRCDAPSLYAIYAGHVSDEISMGPLVRVFAPADVDAGPRMDAGGLLRIGASSGYLSVSGVANVGLEGSDPAGPAYAAPVSLVLQPSQRVFFSVDSGLSTGPIDLRFQAPRPGPYKNALYVPVGGAIGTTLGRHLDPSAEELTDVTLGLYFPELLRRTPEMPERTWSLADSYTLMLRLVTFIPGEPVRP